MGEDPNNSSILQNLRMILDQTLASAMAIVTQASIQALEGLRPIGHPTSIPQGQIWVLELLNGHPDQIRKELGVRKQVFKRLIEELSAQGHTDSEDVAIEEQLSIFLYTCVTGSSCEDVGTRFQRSNGTIKKYFHKMLDAFSSSPIYTKYVKLPRSDDPIPARIANNPRVYPFFKDAIGAIDGMHIVCIPPETDGGAFRNRRGVDSQYCLVCCNFNLEFTYVVSGWEGSVDDERVYSDSRTRDLRIPPGKYYLADAGFPLRPGLLVPYRNIRYHLPRPTNAHEYFNLRHTQLRNVVERVISLLKQRFRILVIPQYEMRTQVRILAALCCIHNIIRRWDPKDIGECEAEQAAATPASEGMSKDGTREVYGVSGTVGDG